MHLKIGMVAVIAAAAAGLAAGRATAPRVSNAPARLARTAGALAAGTTFATTGATADDVVTASPYSGATGSRSEQRRLRGAGAHAGGADAAESGSSGLRVVVYVAGAVARPGVYALHATARAGDALRAAGGATAAADPAAINLAARIEDGEEIAVPLKGAEASAADGAISGTNKHSRRHAGKRGHRRKRHRESDDASGAAEASAADVPAEMVDLNAADESTLETLPGVGPSLAQRIVAFRDLNGPFASTDELLDVGGMTAGKVDALSPYVTFR